MAEIAWTNEALRWLEDIFEYIAADNPDAAADTIQGIYERAQVLAQYPEIGHRYLHSSRNVRILQYGHFRIAYLVKSDETSTFSASSMTRWTSRSINCE
jgi:plasmid stabilization system protein ParE